MIPRTGRLLALDWGEVRIGVAVSDETQLIASPRATLTRRAGKRFPMPPFLALVGQERPVGLIVGLPLTAEGSEGAAARSAREMGTLVSARTALPLEFVDASALFLERLTGVTDPEQKRKIIGATFIDVFEKRANELGGFEYLGQGTLYPDVIESASVSGPAAVIKSHHNVGGLPERMHFKLIEPLRDLFKDEVRRVGRDLGLDREFVVRQPFPGPGLAVRVVGEITRERLDLLRLADKIVAEEIRKHG